MDFSRLFDNLASAATFVGAILVFVQLRIGDRQEAQTLVSAYNARYMEIARTIPLGIFTRDVTLGELRIDPADDSNECMHSIYEYMLLCEEQANFAQSRIRKDVLNGRKADASLRSTVAEFFRLRDNRVWSEAWEEWHQGMKSNMQRRAFREGAEKIIHDLGNAGLSDEFSFVRTLLVVDSSSGHED